MEALFALVLAAAPADLTFPPPVLLLGDDAPGASAGMQQEAEVALGGGQFLVVWSDFRTSPDPDASPPFATEGSGADVCAARLDAAGNPVDLSPILIDDTFGDQTEPRVAWNGQSWLVVWKRETPTLPTYERLEAARVAPDGTVLDDPPIVLHDDQSYYSGTVVGGGAGDWVVLFQTNGPFDGLQAVRVTSAGTVANPGGLQLHPTLFSLEFDLAFAQDKYLLTWGGTFDGAKGQRFAPDLTPLDPAPFDLPFVDRVASDGTSFLVAQAAGSPPLASVRAVLVTSAGTAFDPFTIYSPGGQAGACCAEVAFDGTNFWVGWAGPRFARVTPAGVLLDPDGFLLTPATAPISTPVRFDGSPGGGVQLVWNDGVTGAGYPKDVYTGVVTPGAIGNETLVSRAAPTQLGADLTTGAGTNLVVFQSQLSGTARILAQRLDAAGAALDPEPIEVASGPVPGVGLPSIGEPAAAWNGSLFLITWSDGLQVLGRRMLPDGSFADASPLVIMDGFDPDVAAVGQTFLVVGIDFLLGNPQWQAAHSMRVDGVTGANLDAQPNALGGFVIFAQFPRVVTFGSRWLATWQTNVSHDNPVAGTRGAFVDPDGTTPGVFTTSLGWRPDVAVSDDRALFVAVTNSVASATTDLAGRVMLADGTFLGPAFTISSAPDKQLRPAVSWNGSEFVVAWEDKRGSVIYFDERTDVYGARVAPDGTVLDPAGVPLAAAPEPEVQPALHSVGATTLLATSVFRPDPGLGAYRIGVQADGPPDPCGAPVLAAEIVRLGSPPNPAALLPGQTNGPVVGSLWDPVVDHATFLPGALLDFLGLSATATNVPTPFGTLLAAPALLTFTEPAPDPFAIFVPLDCSLAGASLHAQAVSWDGVTIGLTNALDFTIGSL